MRKNLMISVNNDTRKDYEGLLNQAIKEGFENISIVIGEDENQKDIMVNKHEDEWFLMIYENHEQQISSRVKSPEENESEKITEWVFTIKESLLKLAA